MANNMKKKIDKTTLETFIKNFNEILIFFEGDKYKTVQHVVDRWDKYCQEWIEEYDLDVEFKK